MSSELYVEPTALRAAVTEVAAASQALAQVRGALEAAGDAARAALSADDRAEHEFGTFIRQYREEYELIDGFLAAHCDVLEQAAQVYEELDGTMATSLRG